MEPTENQQIAKEDLDKDCRLRHGLNLHCLGQIFQYLDYADLYTISGMNDFYKQIIIDSVISKKLFKYSFMLKFCDDVPKGMFYSNPSLLQNVTLLQHFERFGSKIKKIEFHESGNDSASVEQLIEYITTYCSPDQLTEITIKFRGDLMDKYRKVEFPDYFRKIEKCDFILYNAEVFISLGESLQSLKLTIGSLSSNFDWTKLKKLTELRLSGMRGINVQNFIDFLSQRPHLKVFYSDRSFDDSTRGDVYNALGKYCGQYIQEFSDNHIPSFIDPRYYYNFMSDLKCLKTMVCCTGHVCGSDLINAFKRLAENNTLEKIKIVVCYNPNDSIESCMFRRNSNHELLDIKHFDSLKSIEVYIGRLDTHGGECAPMKILTGHSAQILSNVENLLLHGQAYQLDLIKLSPKLRCINIIDWLKLNDAIKINSELESILKNRINENSRSDFIEITSNKQNLKLFESIHGRSNAIKLIETQSGSFGYI